MIKDITTQKPEKLSTSQLKQIPLFRLKRTFGAIDFPDPGTRQIFIITQPVATLLFAAPRDIIPLAIPNPFQSIHMLHHSATSISDTILNGGIVQDFHTHSNWVSRDKVLSQIF